MRGSALDYGSRRLPRPRRAAQGWLERIGRYTRRWRAREGESEMRRGLGPFQAPFRCLPHRQEDGMTVARRGRARSHDLACVIEISRPALRAPQRAQVVHCLPVPEEAVGFGGACGAEADDLTLTVDRGGATVTAQRAEVQHRPGVPQERVPAAV